MCPRTRWCMFLLIWYLLQPSMQDCVQNANGFSDLPSGSAVVSDPNYNAGGLRTYYDLVVGFIDTVQPVGYQDVVRTLLPTLLGSGISAAAVNAQSHVTQILVWNVGLLVMVGIGLVFVLAFFLSCCCLCCCRVCGKCGARAHQYRSKHQHAKCIAVTLIMVLAMSLAISGAVTELLSNEDVSQAIAAVNGTASSISTDALNYVTNTVEQVKVILGHLDCTLGNILNVSNDISQSIAKLNISQQFAPFFASAASIENAVGNITKTVGQLDSTSLALQQLALNLTHSLSAIASDLNALKSNCTMSSACNNIPSGSSIKIDDSLNTTGKLLNLTVLTDNIQQVNSTVASIIKDAHSTVANISNNIQQWLNSSQVVDVLKSITSTVDSIKGPADKLIDSSTRLTQKTSALLSMGTSQLPNLNGIVQTYDVYRYWGFAAFGMAILVTIFLFILSLLCGLFGFSNKVHPNERNSLSHTGAICLLLTVALCVLLVLVTAILTVVLFILGAPLQKLCESISSPSYPMFREVMDNTTLWGGVTLIGNVTAGLLKTPINISLSQTLSQCEQNASLWNAVQGDVVLKQLSSQLPSAFQNLTLDSLQKPDSLIPDFSSGLDKVTQVLNDALDLNLTSSVNLSFLDTLLPFNISSYRFNVLQFNLTGIQANLTNLIMELQNNSNTSNLTSDAMQISYSLNNLSLTLIPQVQNKSDELYNMLMHLEEQIDSTADATQSLLTQANATVENIVADAIDEFESIYNGILADVTQFGKNTVLALRNTLGACRPLWSIYTVATNAACKGILNGVNGYWFGMGWSIIFLLPTMVSAIILTTYLRRSRTKVEMDSNEVYENSHVNMERFEMHNRDAVLEYPMDLPNVPSDEW
ncbi:hypothetical protein EMCRGX_G029401 [Ephydatia muelleri]